MLRIFLLDKSLKITSLRLQPYLPGANVLSIPFQVQYAKRARTEAPQPLYMARCYELATQYLGFNGWSVEVKKVSGKLFYWRTKTLL